MNAGAAPVSGISISAPMRVSTSVNHNFNNGDIIIIDSPLQNGLQNPLVQSWLRKDFFVTGIITVIDAVTFSIPFDTVGLTPFSNTMPTFAVPATYSCSQFAAPTFQPTYRLISNVTNGFPAVVTTSIPHNYLTGLVVRLYMPEGIGMDQANKLFGTITVINAVTFSIPIDTTNFTPFIVYASTQSSNPHMDICALAVPIGEDNSQLYQAVQNVLPF